MKNAEQIVNDKKRSMITVPIGTTIHDALQTMGQNHIGAILVTDQGRIVGIWTERDLMRNTLESDFNARSARIEDYMTRDLLTAPHTDSIYLLLDKFLGRRLRHLLIEKEGEIIGILSTGDVIRASLQEKTRELQELNAIVSWEYYENWGWKGTP